MKNNSEELRHAIKTTFKIKAFKGEERREKKKQVHDFWNIWKANAYKFICKRPILINALRLKRLMPMKWMKKKWKKLLTYNTSEDNRRNGNAQGTLVK